jgi:hypothetical protein
MLSFGATGQFYTQMTQAAPFEAFLSADESTPKRLVDGRLAVADSLFTYAVGSSSSSAVKRGSWPASRPCAILNSARSPLPIR